MVNAQIPSPLLLAIPLICVDLLLYALGMERFYRLLLFIRAQKWQEVQQYYYAYTIRYAVLLIPLGVALTAVGCTVLAKEVCGGLNASAVVVEVVQAIVFIFVLCFLFFIKQRLTSFWERGSQYTYADLYERFMKKGR